MESCRRSFLSLQCFLTSRFESSSKIPGRVENYVVDFRGERHEIKNMEELWQETFVSGVLRTIHYDEFQEGMDPLMGLRKIDPLPNLKTEARFLEAAAIEFSKVPLVD